jgi:opacity protein-like surface antigen
MNNLNLIIHMKKNIPLLLMLYPNKLKSWLIDGFKAPHFNDRKRHCIALILCRLRSLKCGSFQSRLSANFLVYLGISLFFMAADAQAQEKCAKGSCRVDRANFYAKILGGANFLQNSAIDGNRSTYQAGYLAAGSLGYCWRYYGLHLEGEYAFRRNAISKIHFVTEGSSNHGHFQTSSYMANLLWDLPPSCAFWNIRPFIGAGIGYDFQRMHSSNSRIVFNQKWNRVSWQVMAGLAYPIFRHMEMTLEYKFHQGGSHFYNNSVGVGLVYKFGFLR